MQLRFSRDEILADHDYATPHIVGDYHLHGGFDSDGHYLSPRTLNRPRAVSHWCESLASKGGSALEIGLELLSGPRFPNYAQHKLMLQHGIGETLWNSFTNVGRTEARGAMIAKLPPPNFEGILLGDLAEMTAGHLKPLFEAHGADEGGIPERGIGGHDQMWFAARDLAFGKKRYPLPPTGAGPGIGGSSGERWMPDLPSHHSQVMRMLMGLLMIEIRAFILFEQSERLLRDPEIFLERREEANLAADVVGRIRADEDVHVGYLRAFFGELRSGRIRCEDGNEKDGREIFDPAWEKAVHNSTQVNARQQRADMRDVIRRRVLAKEGGAEIFEELESLSDPGAFD